MSAFKKHLDTGCKLSTIFGMLTFLCIFYYHGWNAVDAIWYDGWKVATVFMICIAASLFPDIDTKSRSQRAVYAALLVVNIIMLALGQYAECIILGIVTKIPMLTKHRGIFHSYCVAAFLPAIVLWYVLRELTPFFLLCWTAAWMGYTGHLVIDNMPKSH